MRPGWPGTRRTTVYSVHPDELTQDERAAVETVHGYRVLGKVAVADPRSRRKVATALQNGITRSDGKTKKCFWPRHGLRVVEAGRVTEYLICFQCQWIEMSPGSERTMIPTTRDPQELFNRVLTDAGVELAPPE